MHEDSERANQPMLPLVRGDHGDTFHLLLVVFDEPGMLFKSRYILPAVEPGSIDQQPDLPMLPNERIDLRGNLAEVVSFQFIRRRDPQRIGGDNLSLDDGETCSFVVTACADSARLSQHMKLYYVCKPIFYETLWGDPRHADTQERRSDSPPKGMRAG